jgi:uncharacterized protein
MAPWQHRRTSWLLAALSTLILLVGAICAAPVSAVTLDQAARALQKGDRVYDFAGVLSRPDQQRLQDQLEALEQKGLAQGAIVIADRLEGVTIEEFTLGLGERWKVGRSDSDNGFVLAVSIQDRKWRLEAAGDLQAMLPDAVAARLMRDELVPAFKQGRYALGFERLLTALGARLEKEGGVEGLPIHPVSSRPAPMFLLAALLLGAGTVGVAFMSWPRGAVPGRDPWRLPGIGLGVGALVCAVLGVLQSTGSGIGLIIVGIVPAAWAGMRLLEGSWTPLALNEATRMNSVVTRAYWAVVVGGTLLWMFTAPSGLIPAFLMLAVPLGFALKGYFLRTPRACPECRGALRWLPEAEEPPLLREDENLEQRLGSVDYDIWRCQKCQRSAVFSHKKLFAPYQECPRCHRRTLTTRTVLDAEPTMWQDGWASDVTECQNPRCGYRDSTRQRRIERGGYRDDGFGGIIIVPPIGGGWGGHGGGWSSGGDSGGDWGGGGGFDVGDFGGGGGFDGGGASGDW